MTDHPSPHPGRLPREPGVLEELALADCLRLLSAHSLGRLAFNRPTGPVIIPLNYVWHDQTIIFRTSPTTAWVTSLRHAPAAFEVEDINTSDHSGWTVLVQGVTSYTDADQLPPEVTQRLQPWPAGERTQHVSLSATSITGRRLRPWWAVSHDVTDFSGY